MRKKAAYTFPADAGAIVLVELDGEPEGIEAAVLACGAVCEAEGARDVIDRARRRRPRAAVADAAGLLGRAARGLQVQAVGGHRACRPARSPRCSGASTRSAHATICETATFGHAGDGNLHINLLSQETRRDAAFDARVDAALAELFKATLDLGGTLSGEHGIGIAKARYMAWEQSPEVIAWQKKLKQTVGSEEPAEPGQDLRGLRPARAARPAVT